MYARKVGNQDLTFAFPGLTWKDDLVVEDEQTHSLWCHHEGRCIDGPLRGSTMSLLPVTVTTYKRWRGLHPDTRLLVEDKLCVREPEANWQRSRFYKDNPEVLGSRGSRNSDLRLPGKSMVAGVEVGTDRAAYPYASLATQPVVNDEVGKTPVLVVYEPSDPTCVVFDRRVKGRTLTFEAVPPTSAGRHDELTPMLRDAETGSIWEGLTGRAVSGTLRGQQLTPLPAINGYWFVWTLHYPKSRLWQPGGVSSGGCRRQGAGATPASCKSSGHQASPSP